MATTKMEKMARKKKRRRRMTRLDHRLFWKAEKEHSAKQHEFFPSSQHMELRCSAAPEGPTSCNIYRTGCIRVHC